MASCPAVFRGACGSASGGNNAFFRLRLVVTLATRNHLISVASTYFEVLAHKRTLRNELVRRTQWFGDGLQSQIEEQLVMGGKIDWPAILRNLRHHPDQPALAVFDNQERLREPLIKSSNRTAHASNGI